MVAADVAYHQPVMLAQVLAAAAQARASWPAAAPPAWMVDATLGGGGHAQALLRAWPQAQLLGLDRDPAAIAHCRSRLGAAGSRARLVQAPFAQLADAAAAAGVQAGAVALVVADLGVSSHQIDSPARGFSWRFDGPLDMRMSQQGQTAAELMATVDVSDLARLLSRYGQQPHARRVARALCRTRPQTTAALAQAVVAALPAGPPSRTHPATRTFQALRMAVNDELGQVRALVDQLPSLVGAGGQIALISFHSGEDEVVRDGLGGAAAGCICPPRLPACGCGRAPLWQLPRPRLRRPEDGEVQDNPRARSARLRLAARTAAPSWLPAPSAAPDTWGRPGGQARPRRSNRRPAR